MRIDCERCPRRGGEERCEGCLVGVVLDLEDGVVVPESEDEAEVIALDPELARAVRVLADAGLLGEVRRIPREAS